MVDLKVAYVLLRFPSTTETFIAEEIQKIQGIGVDVRLFSLLKPIEKPIHPVSLSLLPLVRYSPGFFHPGLWLAQIHFLFKAPTIYLKCLRTLLKQPAPMISFLMKRMMIFWKSAWIARELENIRIHLVHSHFAWLPAASGWVISRLLGVPFTVTTHAYDIFSIKNDLLKLTTREAAQVITISENNKRIMLKIDDQLEPQKIHLIHCGIDLGLFCTPVDEERTKNEQLQITSVGSLIEKKGHEYLIRACGELKNQGINFQTIIIGGGQLDQDLRSLIHELGLINHVSLVGKKSQLWVKNRLATSDVFVLACINAGDLDGIPVSIMEAMAMGVPVISTPVSGIPELVRNEETGLLVPERDPKSLAAAIIRIANDPLLQQKIVKQSRTLIEQEYDITKNVFRLSRIFIDVVKDYG
ncbi:MAG: glycosyltransferase [Anaerolineales bacterium]|nr:glycosyltransferase [Anaerolineales bacterium]